MSAPDQLRRTAESRLADSTLGNVPTPPDSTGQLLHELQVHQIELEMQNEQLRLAHTQLEITRDRFIDLYEFSPVSYLTLDQSGIIAERNLKSSMVLGVERGQLANKRFAQFVAGQHKDRWYRFLNAMKSCEAGAVRNFELEVLRADSTLLDCQLNCLRLKDSHQPQMFRITLVDISQLKRADDELRIAAITFESQLGIFITDARGNIIRVNRAFTSITGYTAAESLGKDPSMLKSGRHDAAFYNLLWSGLNRTGCWEGEIWDRRKSGEIFPAKVTIAAVKDPEGMVLNYVATLADITLSKLAADEIQHLAFYDALTQLPNRRLLMDRLHQALVSSSRSFRAGALLFIDLDNFKNLNDTLGHDIGDLLLQQVATRLETCVREGDTVARIGGDEFVVMLESLSEHLFEAAKQTEVIANKILATLNQPYKLGPHEYQNSPSIGAVLFNEQPTNVETLLKQSDIAMYQAKKSGRNTFRFFDQKMQDSISALVSLEKELRIALKEQQFKLFFQMQTTHVGKVVGAEALIRWQHPQRGLTSPDAFIPLAEETGLILDIGSWVLKEACTQLKKWETDPLAKNFELSVNVSARQFHQADFVNSVFAVLEDSAINPCLLKLELTESLVLVDFENAILKMDALRKVGVRFSMDDFGTGYSSLAYLTQLPFNEIKIAQNFVRNMGIKTTDDVIVQTIIGMAKSLGMDVLAEGVESGEQRDTLQRLGCPLFQGFLFSKPLPIAEFERLLKII